jgi:hypothetical protein
MFLFDIFLKFYFVFIRDRQKFAFGNLKSGSDERATAQNCYAVRTFPNSLEEVDRSWSGNV